MNKPTTAVILAARKERDTVIPYPLREIDAEGTTLLHRELEILRELGYKKIVIVTGYRHDDFSRYAAPDIVFVRNPDFAFTGSMSSLAYAATEIDDDFLLVESDIICEKRVYRDLSESLYETVLATADERGRGDEAYVETDNGRIINISKDLHVLNHIDGEFIGLSKIRHQTFKKMLLRWESNSNPLLNYEYLLLGTAESHELHYIKFNDLVWCEIDRKEDYEFVRDRLAVNLRRKEDPFDRNNIVDHLKTIFPDCPVDDSIAIEFIGGMTNRNFKISIDSQDYVLRVPGNGTEGMIARENEEKNTQISYQLGLSPTIVYINEHTGIKLTEFIPGAETMTPATIQRHNNMLQAADILRTLHNSKVRLKGEFNVLNEITRYERLMEQAGAVMYDGYDRIREEIFSLSDVLNEIGVDIRPCHNDLVPENFIKDNNGRLFLIDWEYAGMNDPMWDIAAAFIESDFTPENQELFLSHYFQGEIPADVWTRILVNQILMDILWSIWTVVKEKQGDDFGSYGPMRFNRALRNLEKLRLQLEKK